MAESHSFLLQGGMVCDRIGKNVEGENAMKDMEMAQQMLKEGGYTCVACKNGLVHTATHRGVRPLLNWLDEGVDLMGACIADKVVGRGAAFLYRLLGVRCVYGAVMSVPAVKVLRSGGIEAQWGLLTEGIRNRDNTGPCPMEYSTMVTDEPEEALMIIRAELNMLGR